VTGTSETKGTPMNQQALAAFVSRKMGIDATIARLQSVSDDHFGVAPDDVHWGHVGDLGRCLDLLAEALLQVCAPLKGKG
jgi:hypothetical protein